MDLARVAATTIAACVTYSILGGMKPKATAKKRASFNRRGR